MLVAAADPVCKLPPDKLIAAIQLSHWRTCLYFGGTAWMVLTLWLLVRFRTGSRIAGVAERAFRRTWLQGLVAIPLWLVIFSCLQLPEAVLDCRYIRTDGALRHHAALTAALVGLVLGIYHAGGRHRNAADAAAHRSTFQSL
jgi:hypothetical protein